MFRFTHHRLSRIVIHVVSLVQFFSLLLHYAPRICIGRIKLNEESDNQIFCTNLLFVISRQCVRMESRLGILHFATDGKSAERRVPTLCSPPIDVASLHPEEKL